MEKQNIVNQIQMYKNDFHLKINISKYSYHM